MLRAAEVFVQRSVVKKLKRQLHARYQQKERKARRRRGLRQRRAQSANLTVGRVLTAELKFNYLPLLQRQIKTRLIALTAYYLAHYHFANRGVVRRKLLRFYKSIIPKKSVAKQLTYMADQPRELQHVTPRRKLKLFSKKL
jgi:hypothetical protein